MFRHVARLGGAARQARALSTTPAAREELAKAPIQLFGITGRYAHALFSAASKNKALDTVEKELLAVKVRFSWHAWRGMAVWRGSVARPC